MGNALAKATSGKLFGYFEDARRKPFSMNTFQGIFRNARGASPPFIDVYECQDGKEIAFKTVQEKSEISLDSKGHLAELFSATAELLTGKTQG